MRLIYFSIAAVVLILDQLTKWLILARFSLEDIVPVIPGLFSLVRVENKGVAFGFLGGVSSTLAFALIVLFSAAAIGVVAYLLWKSGAADPYSASAFALILGGASGNLLDRMIRGSVVDFLDVYVRSYHWPAFNVADSAIVVGVGLLLLDMFVRKPRHQSADLIRHGNR
jgi:signal peptidase II